MADTADLYRNNPLIHRDRRLGHVALALGALLRLRGPEAAHRLPRPHPQGGHGRLRGDGDRPLRDPALREGLDRLPQRARPRAAPAQRQPPRPPGARLLRRLQGGARRAHAADRADRPRQRLRLGLRRLRLHGRGRGVRGHPREGRPEVHRPQLGDPGPRRQEGRGQADRARGEGLGDAGRERRHRAHAALPPPHPQAAAGAGRVGAAGGRSQGAREREAPARDPGRRRAHGLLRQGHRPLHHRRAGRAGPQGSRGHVHEAPAEPGAHQGHRRRRRQGAAHPGRRAAHPEGRRRQGHRRGGGRGAGHGARGPERGEGQRRRRQQERPRRAQHRADPPQRDPAARQRQVVRSHGRARLLPADARAEAARDLGDPGGAHRGHRVGEQGRSRRRGQGAGHATWRS